MRRIAIVQREAVRNSISESVAIMLTAIKEAAANSAKLIVFGESWL